jgi:hypothetical protein
MSTTAIAHHVPATGGMLHKALNAGPELWGTRIPWSTGVTTLSTLYFANKCSKLEKKLSKKRSRSRSKKKGSATFSKKK